MTFWSAETKFNPFEPLRSYSWTIVFTDNSYSVKQGYNPLLDSSMLQYSLKECSKPEYDVSFTEHTLLTQTFKYPGLLKWKPISIKFASTVDDKKTLEYILYRKTLQDGYVSPRYYDLSNEKKQVQKNSLVTYREKKFPISGGSEYDYTLQQEIKGEHQQISKKISSFGMILNQLDPDGQTIQSWILKNCFASSVSFGKLSYNSEDIVEVSMTIQYDYAIETEVSYYNNLKLKKAETEAELMALQAQQIAVEEINIQEEERLKKEAIDNALNEKRQQYKEEILEELKNKNISENEKEKIQKLLDKKDPYLDSAEILDEVAKAKASKPEEDYVREAQEIQNEYARRGAMKEATQQVVDEMQQEKSKQESLQQNNEAEINNPPKIQTSVAESQQIPENIPQNNLQQSIDQSSNITNEEREAIEQAVSEAQNFEVDILRDEEESPKQQANDNIHKEVSITKTIDFSNSRQANKERDSMAAEARSQVNSGNSTAVYMGGKIESRTGNIATVTYTYVVVPNKQ